LNINEEPQTDTEEGPQTDVEMYDDNENTPVPNLKRKAIEASGLGSEDETESDEFRTPTALKKRPQIFQSDGSNVKTPLTESETQSNITESEDESDIQNDRKRDGSDLQNPENVKKKKIHNSEPLKTKVKGKRAFRNEVQEKRGDGNQIKGQVTINKVC
jgi:hypothetical protein